MPTLDDLELELGEPIMDTWYDDLVAYLAEHCEVCPFDYYGYVTRDLIPNQDLVINLGIPGRNFLNVRGGYLHEVCSWTPASASDTGETGDISWDADFVYVCIDANTWKRTPISTW